MGVGVGECENVINECVLSLKNCLLCLFVLLCLLVIRLPVYLFTKHSDKEYDKELYVSVSNITLFYVKF